MSRGGFETNYQLLMLQNIVQCFSFRAMPLFSCWNQRDENVEIIAILLYSRKKVCRYFDVDILSDISSRPSNAVVEWLVIGCGAEDCKFESALEMFL